MEHVYIRVRRGPTENGRAVLCVSVGNSQIVVVDKRLGIDDALDQLAVASTEFAACRTPGAVAPTSVRIVRGRVGNGELARYAERGGAVTIRVNADLGTDDALAAVTRVMEQAANQDWPEVNQIQIGADHN